MICDLLVFDLAAGTLRQIVNGFEYLIGHPMKLQRGMKGYDGILTQFAGDGVAVQRHLAQRSGVNAGAHSTDASFALQIRDYGIHPRVAAFTSVTSPEISQGEQGSRLGIVNERDDSSGGFLTQVALHMVTV
jgi:hypothetical protein